MMLVSGTRMQCLSFRDFHTQVWSKRSDTLLLTSFFFLSKLVQADTGVHQPRDENSTPYEAKPGPYIGPSGALA